MHCRYIIHGGKEGGRGREEGREGGQHGREGGRQRREAKRKGGRAIMIMELELEVTHVHNDFNHKHDVHVPLQNHSVIFPTSPSFH